MKKNKTKYIVGVFEYSDDDDSGKVWPVAYVGPEGPGTVLSLPPIIEEELVDGKEVRPSTNRCLVALQSKEIEKLIINKIGKIFDSYISSLPILKEIELNTDNEAVFHIERCPKLEKITVNAELRFPVSTFFVPENTCIIYNHSVRNWDKAELDGTKARYIFGDEVEEVGIIRGGHITLGKSVKKIIGLKKADFRTNSFTSVPEYELPLRIDFSTDTPPEIETIAPGSITVAELHVPAGALETYKAHPQWGKAAYFVDAAGNSYDNYASKHKARLKKEAKAKEVKAKEEKIQDLGGAVQRTLGSKKLEKYKILSLFEGYKATTFDIEVKDLIVRIEVPNNSPVEIWDKIVNRLNKVEGELK